MTNDEGMTEARMTNNLDSDVIINSSFVIRHSCFVIFKDMTRIGMRRIIPHGQS
jgi:hypothetical protein